MNDGRKVLEPTRQWRKQKIVLALACWSALLLLIGTPLYSVIASGVPPIDPAAIKPTIKRIGFSPSEAVPDAEVVLTAEYTLQGLPTGERLTVAYELKLVGKSDRSIPAWIESVPNGSDTLKKRFYVPPDILPGVYRAEFWIRPAHPDGFERAVSFAPQSFEAPAAFIVHPRKDGTAPALVVVPAEQMATTKPIYPGQ